MTIKALTQREGWVVAETKAAAEGRFCLYLKPGVYRLVAGAPRKIHGESTKAVDVEVINGMMTQVDFTFVIHFPTAPGR